MGHTREYDATVKSVFGINKRERNGDTQMCNRDTSECIRFYKQWFVTIEMIYSGCESRVLQVWYETADIYFKKL
jgi:hypothetical protein